MSRKRASRTWMTIGRPSPVARCALLVGALSVAACSSNDNPTAPTSNPSTVSIRGQQGSQSFSPNPVSPAGRMVVWRNDDGVTHRIVANDGSFDTGDLVGGATSGAVQTPAGGVHYHCSLHPTTMFGSIEGSGGQAPPPCAVYCE